MVFVKKLNGEVQEYDKSKLRRSLVRAGAEEKVIKKIISEVNKILYDGIETKKIFRFAFKVFKKYHPYVASRYDLKNSKVTGYPLGQLLKSTLKLIAGFGIVVVLTFLLIQVNRMAFLIFEILAVVVGVLLILWGIRTVMNLKHFRTLRYLESPSVFGVLYGIVSVSCLVPLFLYMDGTLI